MASLLLWFLLCPADFFALPTVAPPSRIDTSAAAAVVMVFYCCPEKVRARLCVGGGGSEGRLLLFDNFTVSFMVKKISPFSSSHIFQHHRQSTFFSFSSATLSTNTRA